MVKCWNWISNKITELIYVLHSPMKCLSFSFAEKKHVTISCHATALTISIKIRKEIVGWTGKDKLWEWYHRTDGGHNRRIGQKTAGRKLVVMITCQPSSWEEYWLWLESTQEEETTYVNKILFQTSCKHRVAH